MSSTVFDERSVIRTLGLRVEEKTFWVSRESLAGCSPVFEVMLYKDFAESKQETIELPGKKAKDILEMLCTTFPTPKTKEINEQNVDAMLALADEYQIEELKMKCGNFFSAQLRDCRENSDMVLSTLKKAYQYSMWALFRECAKKCKALDFQQLFPVVVVMRPAAMACVFLYSKHNGYHHDSGRYVTWCGNDHDGAHLGVWKIYCSWCDKVFCETCDEKELCEKTKLDKVVDDILASM